MTTEIEQTPAARNDLGLHMLAAWLNVRPDQIPPENRAHTNAHTMEAWTRVGQAAVAFSRTGPATTSNIDLAIGLAARAHAGQVDKGGQPYILHPLRVMIACHGERAQLAAVLHDTVEDGDVTLRAIDTLFGREVAAAVDALTRRPGEDYADFVQRCAANATACHVKIRDIRDNLDLSRLGREPTRDDWKRMDKYQDALAVLQDQDPWQ